ncbi:MAG: cytidylate kinase-like family protein [Sphaerochaetaceae bacterium]|nr:cytidylate kinase-like family protein [Sphaerochaetaceae bacterium]
MDRIITIGRQFGSGGHEVGLRLAKRLGIPFYDRELLKITAENSRFAESYLRKMDEQRPHFLTLGSASSLSTINSFSMLLPNDEVFIEVGKVISELAHKGPCVIVGRCADYVLKDMDTVNIFICADLEDRINRKLVLEEHAGISPQEMRKIVLETDKNRAKFSEYYTHEEWGKAAKYDLCINTSRTGVNGAVEVIANYLELTKRPGILPD